MKPSFREVLRQTLACECCGHIRSQREAAILLGVEPSTVCRWLKGTREPHPVMQEALLQRLKQK